MTKDHIHTPDDGRGIRFVFVDGNRVDGVFYADTLKGVVRAYRQPLKPDKYHKRALSYTLHGNVEVRANG